MQGTRTRLSQFMSLSWRTFLLIKLCMHNNGVGGVLSDEPRRTRTIGAIFPVLRRHVSNLFCRDRDVFVKFTKWRLESGSRIVFYVSREKLLIGEARVRHIERLNPDVAWSRYKDRIFLDEEEYDKYVRISPISKGERKMSEVTVFELENMKKYRKPVRSIYPVGSSGRYLTKEMINKIRRLSVS